MDFTDVKRVRIPEGEVRYIQGKSELGTNSLLWKRPFTYPTVGLCLNSKITNQSGDKIDLYYYHNLLYDRYGVTKSLTARGQKADDGIFETGYFVPIIMLPSDDNEIFDSDTFVEMYSGRWGNLLSDINTFSFIKNGLANNKLYLVTRYVKNETELNTYPFGSYTAYGNFSVSNKVKLYATPTLKGNEWSPDRLFTYVGDWYFEEKAHETDITITVKTPLITLASASTTTPGIRRIASVQSNFSEFKTIYDTKTGGSFPKSAYPYLVGISKITANISALGISDYIGLMYIGFVVRR